MKIEINLKIILAILLFLLIENLDVYLIFLTFILIHEMCHLVVGIILGGKPKKMTISLFGVSLEFYSYVKAKTLYKIIFYAIGPFANIFIASFINFCCEDGNIILERIMIINYSIGFFNLIPILPLDGGKIVKEILKLIFNIQNASKISIYISKAILMIITTLYSVLIIKIKNITILFLIMYLWHLYKIEERKYNIFLKTSKAIENMI